LLWHDKEPYVLACAPENCREVHHEDAVFPIDPMSVIGIPTPVLRFGSVWILTS
jgi:hypothetical protein